MSEIRLGYGPMVDPIEAQVVQQGFKIDHEKAERFEKHRHAINMLMFAELLPQSQIDKAFQKLHKRIIKEVTLS